MIHKNSRCNSTHTAGYGGDGTGDGLHRRKVHVAAEFAVFIAVAHGDIRIGIDRDACHVVLENGCKGRCMCGLNTRAEDRGLRVYRCAVVRAGNVQETLIRTM